MIDKKINSIQSVQKWLSMRSRIAIITSSNLETASQDVRPLIILKNSSSTIFFLPAAQDSTSLPARYRRRGVWVCSSIQNNL
jgi:hypothetical protein